MGPPGPGARGGPSTEIKDLAVWVSRKGFGAKLGRKLLGVCCPQEVVLELVCRAVFGAPKPALQEEPRHSRKVLGQSLAERRKGAGTEPYPAKVI